MPRTQFLHRWVKSGPATVSLFCVGHKCFELRDLYSKDFSPHSWHRRSPVSAKNRSESELVGGRTKVQPETIEKMANALPMTDERSSGVRNH